MKHLILLISAAVMITACNNKEKREAEVQQAKQALMDSINMANRSQATEPVNTDVAPLPEIVSEEPAIEDKTTPGATPTRKKNPGTKGTPPADQPVTKGNTEPAKPTEGTSTPSSTGPTGTTATDPAPGSGTVAAKEEEKKKKGLNNAAKGAIIGLGTGAAAGAVIGKENRGKGAVIGGVVGAIGGAVGGAVLDKRKAKKEAEKDTVKTEDKK